MSDFSQAVEILLEIEGGYVNNPSDPGGETNFGISKKSYPDLNIKNLTKENAKKIYLKDFWEFYRVYEIEDQNTATTLLILLVNMSPINAVKILQKALNSYNLTDTGVAIKIDGILGHQTISFLNSLKNISLFRNYFTFELIEYYSQTVKENVNLMKFYRGWIKRALL